ncbi:MAG: hypothetical protein JRC87_01855 [Deltaproteobacteria bacterium]|nr:hypothetical protein [Deltaproteobacteria bacterium]
MAFCETVKTGKSSGYAFREGRRQGDDVTPFVRPGGEKKNEEYQALFCASCARRITGRDQAITVDGSHSHTFFNPDGVVFELGCFRSAPGCLQAGEATSEFTWFNGYLWCFCLCRNCGVHLGWHYLREERDFFGLILSRLRE